MVFVKNLPIDITEDELQAIYGRCGPIESSQIYNKRPDLDPGKPSLKEIQKRRQRNRRMFKREESNTPVYARILFRDEEGYNVATNDNLTIFGVVIRKYPCRTVLKNKMRSLFLENLAPGQFSMDIEYKISKFLHPDLYVCLNVDGIIISLLLRSILCLDDITQITEVNLSRDILSHKLPENGL